MSLYDDWNQLAQKERAPKENKAFWDAYFDAETENYKKILADPNTPIAGTLADVADRFAMDPVYCMGFLDGINTSLKKEIKLESLKLTSKVNLDVDLEKLYFNMLNAKAAWLYGLPEWDNLLTDSRRKEIVREYRASKMFVNSGITGRNDPCPCGSGKKHKKCCGAKKDAS
ncbi:MAG: SEC-C domain-containing protein [Clostridiales bacterium]|jgi:hypothetical protein|nr:SEC-C domain-containing protein [Clostridiales bacterium]